MAEKTYKEWIDGFKTNFTYYNPAPKDESGKEQLPIIGSGVVYNNSTNPIPKSVLEEAHLCGFTVCTQQTIGQQNYIDKSLNSAIESKVTLLFNSFRFYPESDLYGVGIEKALNYTPAENEYPTSLKGFGGVLYYDEPSYYNIIGELGSMNEDPKKVTKFQNLYRELMEQGAHCIVYINLVGYPEPKFMPTVDSKEEPDAVRYDLYYQYLNAFQEYFKPSFFCYDLYPISENVPLLYQGVRTSDGNPISFSSDKEGEITVGSEAFYKMFEIFSSYSQSCSRPFWAFCQSKNLMKLNRNYVLPLALEQYLRFEAFTALAYGAKGINYWGYAVDYNTPSSCYLSALVNRKGNKTASWYFAQRVNKEMHKYSDIFLSKDIHSVVKRSQFIYESESRKLEINSIDGEMLVFAQWKNTEITTIMVLNTNPLKYNNINICVESMDVKELTPVKSKGPENVFLNKGNTTRILPPGGYRIFNFLNWGPVPPVGPGPIQ